MAYLHCHDCDWGQDDFWEVGGYNPVRWLLNVEADLLKDKMRFDFESIDISPEGHDDEGPWVSGKAYVAWELRRHARNIEKMAVRTTDEWKQVKNTFRCPGCGSQNLDID